MQSLLSKETHPLLFSQLRKAKWNTSYESLLYFLSFFSWMD